MAKCSECDFFIGVDGWCRRKSKHVCFFDNACDKFSTHEDYEKEMKALKPIALKPTRKSMKESTAEKYGIETAVCATCGQTKPLKEFLKNRWGYTKLCKACKQAKVKNTRGTAKAVEEKAEGIVPPPIVTQQLPQPPALESFSDGELVEELKRRGYTGTIQKTYIFVSDK